MKYFYIILSIPLLIFFTSCDKDEDITPELIAKAGTNQNVKVNEVVTLNGSKSVGPVGFTYSWTYQGEVPQDEISFENNTSATPTFIPPKSGVYTFVLTISTENNTDTDETAVIVSGAQEIGGTLSSDLVLRNIESSADLPDYLVTSDLIIPDGLTLSIGDDDVIVAFQSETGIHVLPGGTISNADNERNEAFKSEFNGEVGWKGIWVENGSIDLEQVLIVNAGKSAFDGRNESAALTLSGSNTNLISFSNNEFVNSFSFDILALDEMTQVFNGIVGNSLSFTFPMKAHITIMGNWSSDNPNILPPDYEYIHLIPGGRNKMDVITVDARYFDFSKGKYYIDGNFWSGTRIFGSGGSTILVKENSGILVDDGISVGDNYNDPLVLKGIDNNKWNGMAMRKSSSSISLRNTIIENAGSGFIEIGGFKSPVSAVIYTNNETGVRLENSQIINSDGYGLYIDSESLTGHLTKTTHFKNTALAAIRTNLGSINYTIREDHGNTFDLPQGVPPVLVAASAIEPRGRLYPLEQGAYYLLETDWTHYGDFRFEPGVHLKFKSGYSFFRKAGVTITIFRMLGEEANPIIIDSELGTPGTWGGLMLEGYFQIDHVIIKNGGEFILPGASEKANVVSAYQLSDYNQQFITNTTISNSGGWGIVVESDTYDFEFDSVDKNNTFSDNESGNIVVK